jgi:hypothetical protein
MSGEAGLIEPADPNLVHRARPALVRARRQARDSGPGPRRRGRDRGQFHPRILQPLERLGPLRGCRDERGSDTRRDRGGIGGLAGGCGTQALPEGADACPRADRCRPARHRPARCLPGGGLLGVRGGCRGLQRARGHRRHHGRAPGRIQAACGGDSAPVVPRRADRHGRDDDRRPGHLAVRVFRRRWAGADPLARLGCQPPRPLRVGGAPFHLCGGRSRRHIAPGCADVAGNLDGCRRFGDDRPGLEHVVRPGSLRRAGRHGPGRRPLPARDAAHGVRRSHVVSAIGRGPQVRAARPGNAGLGPDRGDRRLRHPRSHAPSAAARGGSDRGRDVRGGIAGGCAAADAPGQGAGCLEAAGRRDERTSGRDGGPCPTRSRRDGGGDRRPDLLRSTSPRGNRRCRGLRLHRGRCSPDRPLRPRKDRPVAIGDVDAAGRRPGSVRARRVRAVDGVVGGPGARATIRPRDHRIGLQAEALAPLIWNDERIGLLSMGAVSDSQTPAISRTGSRP